MAEMTLEISAVDKASAVIDAMRSKIDGAVGGMKSAFKGLVDNFVNFHFLVVDAAKLIGKAFEAMQEYAAFDEQRASLNALAGQWNTTGDELVKKIKEVSGNLISIKDATAVAALALRNDLGPEQLVGIAGMAERLSNITGQEVPKLMEDLVTAISKGNLRALETLTGDFGLTEAFGKLSKGMSGTEKTALAYQVTLDAVAKSTAALGEGTKSLDDQLGAFSVRLDDAKLKVQELGTKVGLYLVSYLLNAVEGFQKIAASIGVVGEAIARYILWNDELADKIGAAVDENLKNAAANHKLADELRATASELGKAQAVQGEYTKGIEKHTAAALDTAKAVEAANEKWKLIGGTWTQVNTASATVAAGMTQIKTAADSIPKDVQVKVTTTYVDVRTGTAPSGAEEGGAGATARVGANGEASYGNWGGAY